MPSIELPFNWSPRPYQRDFMAYMDAGGRRAACVWHRRAGKDTVVGHQLMKAAHQRRGLYWHCLPTQRQGRKVVWDAFTKEGVPFLDAICPPELRARPPNSTEMKIALKCGSIYQVVGSDNYDALVGSNPIGIGFSEWSLTNPKVWELTRPILRENDGFAAFIYTPRGYNHGYDLMEMAKGNPEWFASTKNILDTNVLTEADIEEERREGMPEEMIRQEYYCDFSAANVGAILGKYIEAAEKEGRVTEKELYLQGVETIDVFDIGFRDATARWTWQVRPDGFALLHYEEDSGLDAGDWIDRCQTGPYVPDVVYLPHDAKVKTFQSRHSALEQFLKGGFKSVRLVPRSSIADRINAARTVLPKCWFHKPSCKDGLAVLRAWQYKWDEERKVFSKEPEHDWSSHGSDSFTYGATVLGRHIKTGPSRRPEAISETVQKLGLHYAFNMDQLFEDHDRVRARRF